MSPLTRSRSLTTSPPPSSLSLHVLQGPLQHLSAAVDEFVGGALASGSQGVLGTAMRHFARFEAEVGAEREMFLTPAFMGDISAMLHNELTFMLFASFLAIEHAPQALDRYQRSADTVLSYVSAVRSHFGLLIGVPLTQGMPRWRRFVRGLRKARARERRECRAFRAAHLRRAAAALVADDPASVNAWALISCGWHNLNRPSELVSMMRSDLTWHPAVAGSPAYAVIMCKPLKKAPGQGKVPLHIASSDGSGADTYLALQKLECLDPVEDSAREHTRLFRTAGGGAYSRHLVKVLVRGAAHAAGELDLSLFSGRSLRIGGASDLLALGVPAMMIQLMGRWAGDTYRIYSRVCGRNLLDVSRRMSSAEGDTLESTFREYVQSARI